MTPFCCSSHSFSSASTGMESLDQIVLESNIKTSTYGTPFYQMINSIKEVFNDCSTDGWDGYNALAVRQDTAEYALSLIMCFPLDIPIPDFFADTDGHINFEWYKNSNRIVTASISQDGIIYYAALIEQESTNGWAFMSSRIPDDLYALIKKVVWNDK